MADIHKFQIFATVACDILWYYRNKAFHDGLSFDARNVSRHINKVSLEHFNAWKLKIHSSLELWIPPPDGWFKINFDTAMGDYFSAQAAICHDHNGLIISLVSNISHPCDPNYGDALAALLAVSLANSIKLDRFIIEGDSKVVILALQDPSLSQDWKISPVVSDILNSIPASTT